MTSLSDRTKMLSGALYTPWDPELVAARAACRSLLWAFNATRQDEIEARRSLLAQILGRAGANTWIEPPFFCDYGFNIETGDGAYFNFNCVLLDCAPIRIGAGALLGPNVQLYSGTHPIDPAERRTGLEYGLPITIGDNAWLGGSVIVCPGVTIGADSVIGAGSVVTRDIPEGVVAAGNPCRVIGEARGQTRKNGISL
jgi:maltose O-acetyltransferase